jgi:hypothetical protein
VFVALIIAIQSSGEFSEENESTTAHSSSVEVEEELEVVL